jgi:hypothetical protein
VVCAAPRDDAPVRGRPAPDPSSSSARLRPLPP